MAYKMLMALRFFIHVRRRFQYCVAVVVQLTALVVADAKGGVENRYVQIDVYTV